MPKKPRRYLGDDMTAAEVEALVAEQMKCLPEWWKLDVRSQRTRAERDAQETRRRKSAAEVAADNSAG